MLVPKLAPMVFWFPYGAMAQADHPFSFRWHYRAPEIRDAAARAEDLNRAEAVQRPDEIQVNQRWRGNACNKSCPAFDTSRSPSRISESQGIAGLLSLGLWWYQQLDMEKRSRRSSGIKKKVVLSQLWFMQISSKSNATSQLHKIWKTCCNLAHC